MARVATTARDFISYARTWEEVVDEGYVVCGSPETVRRRLGQICETLGMGNLLALLQVGGLSAELTRQNMELFACEVMPFLRKEFPTEGAPPAPTGIDWPTFWDAP